MINEAYEKAVQGQLAEQQAQQVQQTKVTRDWLLDKLIAAESQCFNLRMEKQQLHAELQQARHDNFYLDEQLVQLRDEFVKRRDAAEKEDAETNELRQRIHELSVGAHIEVLQRSLFEGEPPRKLEILSWGSSGGKTLIYVQR
jgi:predicted RNase H-like nuclease (RuvC/YqgF family)